MKKIKLVTVVGTRPELIRLSVIINKCDQFFEHILIHTGQNYDYELNEIFFEELGIRQPDYFLGVTENKLNFISFNLDNDVLMSYIVSASFLFVALLSPFLTSVADYSGRKRMFMQFFIRK